MWHFGRANAQRVATVIAHEKIIEQFTARIESVLRPPQDRSVHRPKVVDRSRRKPPTTQMEFPPNDSNSFGDMRC
jgi:hypothetical protein